jgi:hypothetical protein
MSTEDKVESTTSNDKDGLRIVLDPEASRAFSEMSASLKAVGGYVKFYPSQLVSHIITDFFGIYFERDKETLVSKFFDAKAYIASEVQRAQSADEAVNILKGLSDSIDKIKGKGSRKRGPRRTSKLNA